MQDVELLLRLSSLSCSGEVFRDQDFTSALDCKFSLGKLY
jgi:hypothetical protein